MSHQCTTSAGVCQERDDGPLQCCGKAVSNILQERLVAVGGYVGDWNKEPMEGHVCPSVRSTEEGERV